MHELPSEYPAWYKGLLNLAISVSGPNHYHNELIESALGIGGMIHRGEIEEAKRLYPQAICAIYIAQATGIDGEDGQLPRMLLGSEYPPELCQYVVEGMGFASIGDYRQSQPIGIMNSP